MTATTPKPPAAPPMAASITFRTTVEPADIERVRAMVRATGFFSDSEVDVAAELVEETVEDGDASGYHFIFAVENAATPDDPGAQRVLGYTCFGAIPCTASSYDLYWIAVDPAAQGRGIGRLLAHETERAIAAIGGRRVYIETSSRPQYEPTRGFYTAIGYTQAAFLPDFYGEGDGKLIYVRTIA